MELLLPVDFLRTSDRVVPAARTFMSQVPSLWLEVRYLREDSFYHLLVHRPAPVQEAHLWAEGAVEEELWLLLMLSVAVVEEEDLPLGP